MVAGPLFEWCLVFSPNEKGGRNAWVSDSAVIGQKEAEATPKTAHHTKNFRFGGQAGDQVLIWHDQSDNLTSSGPART